MNPEQKKYILENTGRKSFKEMARELHLKEKNIRRFAEKERAKGKLPEIKKETHDPQRKKKLWLFAVLIIVIGLAVYSNSFKGQFLWDDESLVKHNPYIKDWSHFSTIFTHSLKSGGGGATNFYRPIQIFSYMTDYSLWQLDVMGFHLTNVCLHILVALSIFWLIQILFKESILSLLTALLFVVHPIHTEAVSYISGRADPLAALFILLCFILYIKSLNAKSITNTILMGLSFCLALLSRENSLILPVLLLLYHYTFKKPIHKRSFIILVSIGVGYVLWRLTFLGAGLPSNPSAPTLLERIPGFFVAITSYVRLLVLPVHLHMEYGGIIFPFTEPKAILGILLLFSLLIYAYKKREQDRLTFFSVYWFFIALLPASNIYLINAYMAEHWLYLPSIGFFLVLSRFLTSLFKKRQLLIWGVMVTAILLAFYSLQTFRQNRYWSEPTSFYKRLIHYAPHSSRLFNNLAKAYHEIGRDGELIELLQYAIEIEPDNAIAHNNLGNAYKSIGNYSEAVRFYNRAIDIEPKYAGPYYNLALIYSDIDKNDFEAIKILKKALEVNPHFPQAYHKIGLIYLNQGKMDEAFSLLNKALKINPDDAGVYHSLGYIYASSGNKDKAKDMYLKAIEINPNYADAHHDLAVIYVSENQYQLAIKYYDRAEALGYIDPTLLETLKSYR